VLSISVVRAFKGLSGVEGLQVADFWHHAVAVAITSRFLAVQSRSANPDQAFVGGLLHDIGKILLAQLFPELFSTVWACMRRNGVAFVEAERRMLPVDHAFIGTRLAKRWRLPEDLSESIQLHHRSTANAELPALAAVVALANGVVNTFNAGVGEPSLVYENENFAEALKPLMCSPNDWYPGLQTAIKEGSAFFLNLQ
jgi:putative nucleotidyltransferase with HDIG domain